jgi:hypothetical protein
VNWWWLVKVGDLVKSSYHDIQGIVVEAGSHPDAANGPAARIKWFNGDESIEWTKFLRMISESR